MADADHTPRILVDDRQDASVDLDVLISLAAECLTGEGVANAELSVSFVTEEEMADLHVRYMAEDRCRIAADDRLSQADAAVRGRLRL